MWQIKAPTTQLNAVSYTSSSKSKKVAYKKSKAKKIKLDGKPAQSWQREQGSQRYLRRGNGETEMQKRQTGLLREAGLTTATRNSESMIRTARGSTTQTETMRRSPARKNRRGSRRSRRTLWEAVLRPWRRPAFLSAMRRCRERTSTF